MGETGNADFREWLETQHDRLWSPDLWPRAFWFDVFISHRRLDWSREFATAVAARGAVVYHDNDVDVRDARVQFELDAALRNARFIVVCASPGLAESV